MMTKLVVTKCDRCGREIIDPHDVFIVEAGKNYRSRDEATHVDLCEWCYRCLLDWIKDEGVGK